MELAGLALELGKLIWSPIRDCCKYHRGLNEYMEALKEKLEELQCHKHDIELRLRTECLPGKKAQREVQLWQEKVKRLLLEVQELNVEVGRIKCFSKAFQGKAVLQKIKEVEDLLQRSGNLSNKFSLVVDADDGKMLPAATLTGDSTAKRKMAEVWECLLSNDVQKIGLYGIGGSGKTTIMKHVYNQLLERTDKFDNVIWVTMSTAFDVIPIQQDIAEELRLDLSNFEEETKRAQELYAAFRGKRRCLLILDDLWEAFPLNRIGIPEPTLANGCKIVLTTRSLEVCRRMDCKAIRMELLTKDEAWELFLNEVGQDVLLRMDLKAIAEQVAKECACLPLAIVAIASSLKGSVDMSDWLNALEELKKSGTHTDMGTQVIEKLKLSYSRLKDKKLQHCLLHCALYPKDEEIYRDALINDLMDEGVIDDSDSRQAQVNKGHAMLNELENACLLESCESYYGSRCVKMHDLVREMALQIMNATPKAMVEAGLGLKRIPDQEKWFEDLVKVS